MAVVRLDVGFRRSEGDSIMRGMWRTTFMWFTWGTNVRTLEIVWRNPVRLPKTDPKLRRIRKDVLGALYAVTNVPLVQWYELVRHEVA